MFCSFFVFADLRMNECNVWLSWCAVQFYAEFLLASNHLFVCCINVLLVCVFCRLENEWVKFLTNLECTLILCSIVACSFQIACLLCKCPLCFVILWFLPTWEWMRVMFGYPGVQFNSMQNVCSPQIACLCVV